MQICTSRKNWLTFSDVYWSTHYDYSRGQYADCVPATIPVPCSRTRNTLSCVRKCCASTSTRNSEDWYSGLRSTSTCTLYNWTQAGMQIAPSVSSQTWSTLLQQGTATAACTDILAWGLDRWMLNYKLQPVVRWSTGHRIRVYPVSILDVQQTSPFFVHRVYAYVLGDQEVRQYRVTSRCVYIQWIPCGVRVRTFPLKTMCLDVVTLCLAIVARIFSNADIWPKNKHEKSLKTWKRFASWMERENRHANKKSW